VKYSLVPTSVDFAFISIDEDTGQVTIAAKVNAYGSSTIQIIADDGQAENSSSTESFDLIVNPVNDAPVADDLSIQVFSTVTSTDILAAIDVEGDNLVFSLSTTNIPNKGVAIINSDGSFTYRSNEGELGMDTFEFDVSDGESVVSGTINIEILEIGEFGSGSDGSIVISNLVNINTDLKSNGRSAPDGEAFHVSEIGVDYVEVSGFGTGSTSADNISDSITIGDDVILINMRETGIAEDYQGSYEFLKVNNIIQNKVIFDNDLKMSYGHPDAHGIMLQRVPNYNRVEISETGVLSGSEWNMDKQVGGLLVFKALYLVNNGVIEMNAKSTFQRDVDDGYELSAGFSSGNNFSLLLKGTGGGGGGYKENGKIGGCGDYWSAGIRCRPVVAGGLQYGNQELTKIFMGTKGGNGGNTYSSCFDNSYSGMGSEGGYGGGIIILKVFNLDNTNGKIEANGIFPQNDPIADPNIASCRISNGSRGGTRYIGARPGGGGGGSGGSILIQGHSLDFHDSDNSLFVEGGSRGDIEFTGTGGFIGGIGSDGRVAIYSNELNGFVDPNYYKKASLNIDYPISNVLIPEQPYSIIELEHVFSSKRYALPLSDGRTAQFPRGFGDKIFNVAEGESLNDFLQNNSDCNINVMYTLVKYTYNSDSRGHRIDERGESVKFSTTKALFYNLGTGYKGNKCHINNHVYNDDVITVRSGRYSSDFYYRGPLVTEEITLREFLSKFKIRDQQNKNVSFTIGNMHGTDYSIPPFGRYFGIGSSQFNDFGEIKLQPNAVYSMDVGVQSRNTNMYFNKVGKD